MSKVKQIPVDTQHRHARREYLWKRIKLHLQQEGWKINKWVDKGKAVAWAMVNELETKYHGKL